ncbi:MAG: Holliday junction resolvase RuvX [Anaerolineae bacterium]|nr:MAG: Holliday junction resolvase RuvX [Anaerolineae bacterium]
MRILAVDHGEKRIGIAVSDPTATIASPLTVLEHISRAEDAARVAELARSHEVGLIVVGQSLDDDGRPTRQGRSAARFADALRACVDVPVVLWDEAFSTYEALEARRALGIARKKRREPVDALAATVILQSYLEARRSSPHTP